MAEFNEHKPTQALRTRVSDLAIAGIPVSLIADIINLDDDTVKKHYKRELNCAEPEAIERVAKTIVMQALGGCPKSQALYVKTKGAKFGWVEKQVVETIDNSVNEELKAKINDLEDKFKRDY
jgi:hypothetical protein